MNEYPDWDDDKTPHTHKKARVTKTRKVKKDVYAIKVNGGKCRSATLDGTFELVSPPTAMLPSKVQVRCSWFGVTPRTKYPELDISSATKVIQKPNYTGDVADDISFPKCFAIILKEDSEYKFFGDSPKQFENQNLCFVVRGYEQDVCNYIAESVANAANDLVGNHQHALKYSPNEENNYVYLLDDNDNKPFYVGVGVRDRAEHHARNFEEYKIANNRKELERPKNIKIAEVYDDKNNLTRLHRVVAFFKVNLKGYEKEHKIISKITAHALENLLITHFYGVNSLTNETGGDKKRGDNWAIEALVRPHSYNDNDDREKDMWGRTIVKFIKGDRLTQQNNHFLKLIALKPYWSPFLCDLRKYLHEELRDVLENDLKLDFDGTDFGGYISFPKSPVRIQLKGSGKEASVRINLRINRTIESYTPKDYRAKLSASIYGDRIPADIRCKGSAEYFKPYGLQDFIISHLKEDSELITKLRELIKQIK